jgi:hypothetical protein
VELQIRMVESAHATQGFVGLGRSGIGLDIAGAYRPSSAQSWTSNGAGCVRHQHSTSFTGRQQHGGSHTHYFERFDDQRKFIADGRFAGEPIWQRQFPS